MTDTTTTTATTAPATTTAAAAQPADADERLFSLAEMEEAVKEAEAKGYARGRNEQIEALMEQPGLFSGTASAAPASTDTDTDDDEPFLRYIRPSVWD